MPRLSESARLKESEKEAAKAQSGEYLKSILSEFCRRNNIPYPQTVLPQANGPEMIICRGKRWKSYRVCNELILSWDGKSSAFLKIAPYHNDFMETQPRAIIPGSRLGEGTVTIMYPQTKTLHGYFEIGSVYSLKGVVDGKNISLEARTSSLTTHELPPKGEIKSTEHPEEIERLDHNRQYWFLK